MTEQFALWETARPAVDDFRPIHYLGSKLRLLDVVEEIVDEVEPHRGRALDLFSGSGVVARRLTRSRGALAVDIQEYARVLAAALFAQEPTPPGATEAILDDGRQFATELLEGPVRDLVALERCAIDRALTGDPEPLATVLEHGSILAGAQRNRAPAHLRQLLADAAAATTGGPNTVLTRYYGGVYFSYAQAAILDGLAASCRALEGELRDVALATLLSTASELVSSVGNQFAQPVRPRSADGRPKRGALSSVARRRLLDPEASYRNWAEKYRSLERSPRAGIALCGDFRTALQELPHPVSVVYADPPYTRDHYSRFYHVLETITVGDEPEVSSVVIGGESQLSRGLYRAERHQSPFCIKSAAPGAFNTLFELVRALDTPLLLSYSPYAEGDRPRLMTIDQISAMASEHFSDVEVRSAGRVAHSKLNADRLNSELSYDAEVLVVCRP